MRLVAYVPYAGAPIFLCECLAAFCRLGALMRYARAFLGAPTLAACHLHARSSRNRWAQALRLLALRGPFRLPGGFGPRNGGPGTGLRPNRLSNDLVVACLTDSASSHVACWLAESGRRRVIFHSSYRWTRRYVLWGPQSSCLSCPRQAESFTCYSGQSVRPLSLEQLPIRILT